MVKKIKAATVVISDLHLGSDDSKVNELVDFLANTHCDKLILNGDIVDDQKVDAGNFAEWKEKYLQLSGALKNMMYRDKTEIVYVKGNHDVFSKNVFPFGNQHISIVDNYIHHSHGKKYYVVHGDIYDKTIHKNIRLHKLKNYSHYYIHQYGKKILRPFGIMESTDMTTYNRETFHDIYRKSVTKIARSKNYDGIICGHIHMPGNSIHNNVHYLNSGDWTGSLTALIEDHYGEWEIFRYPQQKMPPKTETIHHGNMSGLLLFMY